MISQTPRSTARLSVSLSISLSLALAVATAAAAADPYQLRLVVKSGDAAPGSLNGTFTSFGTMALNASGQVAFQGMTTGAIADTGMWMTEFDDPQSLELIAGEDWPVPGAPGVHFGVLHFSFFHPLLNDAGNVGFSARVTVPADGVGLFRKVDGVVQTVALPGQPMQGGGVGTTIAGFGNLISFNEANLLATTVSLAGPSVNAGNDTAVAMTWFGGFQIVAREGGGAPGLPGRTFGSFSGDKAVLAPNGQVGFTVPLNGAPGATWSRWRGWPGALQSLAKQGDATPHGVFTQGVPDFFPLLLSESGGVFRASVDDGADIDTGIWHVVPGNAPVALALTGNAGPVGTYVAFDSTTLRTAGDGGTLFAARCAGPGVAAATDTMLIRRAPGSAPQILLRENDPAIGYGPGVVFDEFVEPSGVVAFGTNGTGWALVRARVRGPGISASNDIGLWSVDADGALRFIARKGALISLGGGPLKSVADLTANFGLGDASGRRASINARGDVAFRLTFTDATMAILVAQTPPACPGDLNGDGVVDPIDLGILLGAWGTTGPVGTGGDIDLDGDTDAADLALLLGAWGVCKG